MTISRSRLRALQDNEDFQEFMADIQNARDGWADYLTRGSCHTDEERIRAIGIIWAFDQMLRHEGEGTDE